MAKRIFRVDVSAGARDFEALALEPGVPLLDPQNTNDSALRKALKRLAAQPARAGDIVEFFVCAEDGSRPRDIECEPATDDDLKRHKELRDDLAELLTRVQQVEPPALRDRLRGLLQRRETDKPAARECSFFKYRDGRVWRLVWCWGYQLKGAPDQPAICTNPKCSLLFAKRHGSRTCPACHQEAVHAASRKKAAADQKKSRLPFLALAAVLMLAAGLGGWWLANLSNKPVPAPSGESKTLLAAVPDRLELPLGARAEFAVKRRTLRGTEVVNEDDVSSQAVVGVDDPRVARCEPATRYVEGRRVGETVVRLHVGSEEVTATIKVTPRQNPDQIAIAPAPVKLGVGATARLRVLGKFANNAEVDLTESAQWSHEGANVFLHRGLIEGLSAGTAKVRARYRATPEAPELDTSADVTVEGKEYEALKLALDHAPLAPRESSAIVASLVDKKQAVHSASGGSRLSLAVEPPEVARIDDQGVLQALAPGAAKLKGTWGTLSAELPFEVRASSATAALAVRPNDVQMVVGEVVPLEVTSTSTAPLEFSVANDEPGTAAVASVEADSEADSDARRGRLVGLAAGKATVTVKQEGQQAQVVVEVSRADFKSLAIVPARVSVPLDGTATLRLVATLAGDGGREADLAADQVTVERLPAPGYVDFDAARLSLKGVQPTEGSDQTLTVRRGALSASATIEVTAPPARLVLEPDGPLAVPRGQSRTLAARVIYAGGRRVDLSPDRVEWRLPEPLPGWSFDAQTGAVYATQDDAGPMSVQARFLGQSSNAVEVRLGPAEPTKLVLEAEPAVLLVGAEGRARLRAADSKAELAGEATFASSADTVVKVDPLTGAFRGVAAGKATLVARHPASADEVRLDLQVVALKEARLELRPASVRLEPEQEVNLQLVLLTKESPPREAIIAWDLVEAPIVLGKPECARWSPPALVGVAPSGGPFQATVNYRGLTATTQVQVQAPESVRLVADQGNAVLLPVGAEYAGLRVLAKSAAGERDVTAEARLVVQPDSNAPVAVADGKLKALRAGKAQVHAEFHGVKSAETLPVEVTDKPTWAALRLEPSPVELQIGESVTLRALGELLVDGSKKSAGDITQRGDLVWESSDASVLQVDGPLLTGKKEGSASVIARLGDQRAAVDVRVRAVTGAELVLAPRVLRLKVGESKTIGTDVTVTRGGADFSRAAEIVSSRPDLVTVDREKGLVTGVAEGRAELAVRYAGSQAVLPVEVQPLDPRTKGTVVVEPAEGVLAVGESLPLRVLLVTEGGQRIDRTASATIVVAPNSSDKLTVQGNRVVGVAPGQAFVRAELPEGNSPPARFYVRAEKFERLIAAPSAVRLALGDEARIRVLGIGPAGRRELTDSPALEATANPSDIITRLGGTHLRGSAPGRTTVTFRFDAASVAVPVEVVDEAWTDLRLVPTDAAVLLGGQRGMVAFATRGGREREVRAEDGLELRVGDPSRVRLEGRTVTGLRLGSTEIRARLGTLQTASRLQVVTGSTGSSGSTGSLGSNRSARSGGSTQSAPRRRPQSSESAPRGAVSLRFVPDVLRLQRGAPAEVRLRRDFSNGDHEFVDHVANWTATPIDVAEIERTAAGLRLRGVKEGVTRVHGTYGGLTTANPLVVRVVDEARVVRLSASPDPLFLNVGERSEFRRVQLEVGGGSMPAPVDYRVVAANDGIVTVRGRELIGAAPGRTQVTIVPVGVDDRFRELRTTANVVVRNPRESSVTPGAPSPRGPNLVLRGPSLTSVGAEVQYEVELIDAAGARDVTRAARLVLGRDQAAFAEVHPGGSLTARRPGTVFVRAVHGDLVSNAIGLRIDSLAPRFDRLEFEIDRNVLMVGEVRGYRLWAHPATGGDPQDVTNRAAVTAAPVAFEDGNVIEHVPPTVLGKSPGPFVLTARVGSLTATSGPLTVLGAGPVVSLSADPATLVLRHGESTPPIRILARRANGAGVAVNAELSSSDPGRLAPAPGGRFVAQQTGQAQIRAAFGGQSTAVDVTIVGNPFVSTTNGDVRRMGGNGDEKTATHFRVPITIVGDRPVNGRSYRAVADSGAGEWQRATETPAGVTATVDSPTLAIGPEGQTYHLILESRDEASGRIERFPHDFRLKLTAQGQGP